MRPQPAEQAQLTSAAAPAPLCLCPALRCVPVQGSSTAEQLSACTPGRSVPRSPQTSRQQSVLSRPFAPGPPRRYPGREGAAPGRPRAVKAGTAHTPARLPCARPHLPVMAASPALWPRGSGLDARLGLAAVAPAGSADPAPAAAPAPRAWAGTAGLGDSGQPPRTCA